MRTRSTKRRVDYFEQAKRINAGTRILEKDTQLASFCLNKLEELFEQYKKIPLWNLKAQEKCFLRSDYYQAVAWRMLNQNREGK